MKALTAVLFFVTLCSTALSARPLEEPGATAPQSSSTATSATAASGTSGESLFEKTLPSDIDTASYYELLAWVRRLGLSEKGTRSELQARLREYYKVSSKKTTPPSTTAPSTGNERIITVKSAHQAEYFTLEKVDQKYIRLSGGVDLQMYDPKTDTTHTIVADTIVFNQTEKTITATGHIEYTLTGKQKSEVFRGASLTFNVDNWNGIFFQGVSESKKTIDQNALTFYYSGQKIHRSSNDVVTLDNGTITSSDALPPNYQVTASRIWVLAPGEWALSNAVLYLGRVPIFYFPFFFHPGDNLFFHPSAGYREEEGYYLQTTTYLLGRRSKTNSSLSFLQVTEDTNVNYNTKIRGLFLRKTTPVTAAEQKKTPYDFQQSYVKLLFDIYSRLGVFAGIESKIVDYGVLKNLQADFSLARSRNIFLLPGASQYTANLEQADGSFTSLWNSSSLFGVNLPVRYGMDLELNLTSPIFSMTGSLPFYSDPSYHADFSNREESIDWSKILGLSGSSTTTSTATQTSTQTQTMTSLLWSLHSTYTPDVGSLKPYVSQASITAADLSMYWQTKTNSTAGVVGLDPNLPNFVPISERSDFAFPGKDFFYPQSFVFPSVSGKITGTIFQTASTTAQPAAAVAQPTSKPLTKPEPTAPTTAQPKPPSGSTSAPETPKTGQEPPKSSSEPISITARPPWQESQKQKPSAEKSTLKVPEPRPDYSVTAPSVLSNYTQSLTYSITPTASVEDRTVTDGWLTPADINLADSYSIFNSRGSGALTYNGALLGKLLTIQNTTALSGNYKIHYNQVPGIADWQSFLLQDYNATFLKATDALSLATYPFEGVDLLQGTNFSYSIAADLFARNWVTNSPGPVFQNSFLSWDSSHITAHSLASSIVFSPWNQVQNLNVTVTLPPLVPQVSVKAISHAGPLTTTVSDTFSLPQDSSTWQFQPLTLEGILTPVPWFIADQTLNYDFDLRKWTTSTSKVSLFNNDKSVNASETFTYDLADGYPTDSLTSLKLWFFNMQFEAKRTNLYQFSPVQGWTATGAVDFVPSNLSMGVSYDYKSAPLWKNRIELGTNVNTAWNINLLQFTDNALTLNLTATLSIYQFLDISFSLQSEDRATYRYIPAFASQVGQTPISPATDLLKSINFFSNTDRKESNFKMKSVDLKLVHHLEDWDLNMEFTGTPELTTSNTGVSYYQWNPTFTLSVDWKPVPEIKSNVVVQNNQISF